MTTNEGKYIIFNGWNAAKIRHALDEGLEKLSDLEPYQDIDPMLTLFEEECNITKFLDTPEEYHQVLGFLPVLHSDDAVDNIFENDTYLNEYWIKKDKTGFKFLYRFHDFPEISKMFETHALENFTFQH